MRAILIDPFTKVVAETDIAPGLSGIRQALGCDLVTATPLTDGSSDVVYLDDEGLFVEGQAWFGLAGHPQPYAGKGLVLGSTGPEGNHGNSRAAARSGRCQKYGFQGIAGRHRLSCPRGEGHGSDGRRRPASGSGEAHSGRLNALILKCRSFSRPWPTSRPW